MQSMLYVFFGTDTLKIRKEALLFLAEATKSGTEVVTFTAQNFDGSTLIGAAGSTSLFGASPVYVLDTPSETTEMSTFVFESLEALSSSSNTFVLIEVGLLAADKKALTKYATEMNEFVRTPGKVFNVFSLTDALARRDKRALWVLLMEAKREGFSEEEIIGTLFWQMKSLRLAGKTTSAEEAGMKPFVYTKSKSALSKFKEGEVDTKARELVSLYHDGHRGVRDIGIALEKWVLSF